eukprot:COSAG02_NODE_64839_length_259_cov_0.962500_1_plen_37_part_01
MLFGAAVSQHYGRSYRVMRVFFRFSKDLNGARTPVIR